MENTGTRFAMSPLHLCMWFEETAVFAGGKVLLIPKMGIHKVLRGRCQRAMWGIGTFSYKQIYTGKYTFMLPVGLFSTKIMFPEVTIIRIEIE